MKYLALLAALVPAPAMSLSCMPWDVAQAYSKADQSDAAYIVAHGELSFDTGLLPVTNWENQHATPKRTDIPARLTGLSLTANGFTEPFDAAIILQINCSGPWCPRASEGPALTFLKREGSTYRLVQNACGGMLFGNPAPEDLGWTVRQRAPEPER